MQIDLVIAEWNANGVSNHRNEIELFLHNNYVDILLISETHFTSKSFFQIKDYDVLIANHPDDRAHGGAAIIIRSKIKYKEKQSITEPYLQAAGINIVCENSNISIYSVYFPPRYNIKCNQYENFFKSLGNKFIVGGDFNAKHIWWGSRLSNPKGRELYKCISGNQYNILTTGSPTYWPTDVHKIPDLLDFFVFTGICHSMLSINTCDDLNSDHTPIIANFRTTNLEKHENQQLITSRTDISIFQKYIHDNIDLNISIKNCKDIEDAIENFINTTHHAAKLSTPKRVDMYQSGFHITCEIRRLIREKGVYGKYGKQQGNPPIKQCLTEQLNN